MNQADIIGVIGFVLILAVIALLLWAMRQFERTLREADAEDARGNNHWARLPTDNVVSLRGAAAPADGGGIRLGVAPEYSEWVCYLFGGDGIQWRPLKGQEPCWFWRVMQRAVFGNRWERKP